jgi:hypothetical protein
MVKCSVFFEVRAEFLNMIITSASKLTQSRFSVVFNGRRANAELVPIFHVGLRASHAALTILTSKFLPAVAHPF